MTASTNQRLALGIASLGGIITALQAVSLVVLKRDLCQFDGCKVVDELTRVSPWILSFIGAVFFSSVVLLIHMCRRQRASDSLLAAVVVAGLTAEGVFVGYQLLVAKTICPYCLTIFSLVAVLNLVVLRRDWHIGVFASAAVVLAMSLLQFGEVRRTDARLSLDAGTYAVSKSSAGLEDLYLLFSESCSHCLKTVEALQNQTLFRIHYNPVYRLTKPLDGNVRILNEFDPAANRATLTALGLQGVPVAIVRTDSRLTILHGATEITKFIAERQTPATKRTITSSSLFATGTSPAFGSEPTNCRETAESCD